MTKKNIPDILKRVKELFDSSMPPAAQPADPAGGAPPAAPDAGNGSAVAQYNVDGGQPVFVNISDDGIADIDQADAVFTDAACTAPYPDGTYKVTGTDFSFTVAGGIVTAVTDPDGKGAGTPVQAPAAAPAPAPAPAAPDFSNPAAMKKEFEAFKQKFASGGTPSLQELAVMVQALFENIFQYDLQRAKQAEAIAAYQDSFTKQELKMKEQDATIGKQKEIIAGLFEAVEAFSQVPGADPIDQPKAMDLPKNSFKSKEEKLNAFAGHVSGLKKSQAK